MTSRYCRVCKANMGKVAGNRVKYGTCEGCKERERRMAAVLAAKAR